MTELSLAGQRIFITGSGSGIGETTARKIVACGGRVAIMDLRDDLAQDVAQSLGHDNAMAFGGDVCDEAVIEKILHAMSEKWGGIDGVVNNVGIYDHGPLLDLTLPQWRRVFETNLMAPIAVSCAAVRRMRDGGCVVNVSSVLGEVAAPERGPYCVSKAALISLTKMQAIEWAKLKVRVNAIAPGYILNQAVQDMIDTNRLDPSDIERRTPMGRMGSEEEIAEGICFLLDPVKASFMTGELLSVNGGWTAYGFT